MIKKKFEINSIIKILALVFFLVFLVIPLGKLFLYLGDEGIAEIGAKYLLKALTNTLVVGIVSSLLAVAIGFCLAFLLSRSQTRIRSLFSLIFVIPMLVPTIAHGSGLIILFGNNAIFRRFLGLGANIYGFWGCVAGFILCTFPLAFIMFRNVLRYEDKRQYEVADVLGVGKLRQFWGITLPYIFKSFTSVFCAIFALVISDYGVPLMVGGHYKTLALLMYNDVIGLAKGSGSVISVLLLAIAFVVFIAELKNQSNTEAFKPKHQSDKYSENRAFIFFSKLILTVAALFILLYIGVFSIAAFTERYPYNLGFTLVNFTRTLGNSGIRYLKNSLLGALGAAAFGTILAYIFAYYTGRTVPKTGSVHILAVCPAAIPGIVLGLGYVLVFKGSFIYGTMLILILINIVHFFAPGYLLAYNALLKINKNVEAVAEIFGINKFKALVDIILPTTYTTALDMFSYFFVSSMITISAVSFIANTRIKPLSLMIPQYENQQQTGNVAVVVLVILAVNLGQKSIIWLIKKRTEVFT